MICIGILSAQKEKAGALRKIFFPISVTDRFKTEVDVVVAELAFTEDEVRYMPEKFRTMLYGRGAKLLKKHGASQVVLTKACAAAFDIEKERIYTKERIPKEYFAQCLDFALSKIGNNFMRQTIYIKDSKMTTTNYSVLEKTCQKVRYIKLLTENTEKAEELGERLYREYGIFPEIQSADYKIPASAVIAADADKGIIRLGRNYIVDGIERKLDLHGYDVCVNTVLDCMGEEKNKLKVEFWLSGKKRLTR